MNHPDLGDFEMDVIVADEVSILNYSPPIEEWLQNVTEDETNDGLTAYWDPTNFANTFQLTIMENVSLGPWYYATISMTTDDYTIQLGGNQKDDSWTELKEALSVAGEGKCYLLVDWRSSKPWGDYMVNAEFRANDLYLYFSIPPDVAKTYDVYADYTADADFFQVDIYNAYTVFTIEQQGRQLTALVNGEETSGEVERDSYSVEFSLAGDILPGQGRGGYQYFTGDINQDGSISGSISGTVVEQFPGHNTVLGSIRTGSFNMYPRD